MENSKKIHCFIVGAKSIGQYGGYETFVMKLLEYSQSNKRVQFHVACKANGDGHMDVSKLPGASKTSGNEFEYCGARAFMLRVPQWLGSAQAVYYDIAAMKECCSYIEKNRLENAVVYVLACRIGPFIGRYVDKLHSLGAKLYLNPDGHEWKRAKWSASVRRYWKESERLMVKATDLVICDSVNIEKYIRKEYAAYTPKTTYIAYGADSSPSGLSDDAPRYVDWLRKYGLRDGKFYISVGRFVPENNYEVMIREFMRSATDKNFVIITTENLKFFNELNQKLHFDVDKRIRFVGTVYDQKLLRKIRENAYGYIHGHEVGGTNPSLLEALGSTKLNLLLDVEFNREVADDAAFYWTKEINSLATLINDIEQENQNVIDSCGEKAKRRIHDVYNWELIVNEYLDTLT